MKETIEQFLKRGGKITKCKPYAPVRRCHRTKTHETRLQQAIGELWKGNFLDAIELAR